MSGELSNVFLTGATGVVGSEILRRLLHRPATNVTVLIRDRAQSRHASEQNATLRLKLLLDKIDITDSETIAKVRLIDGDITQPRLGLSEESLSEIRSTCTHLVHSAGKVKLSQSIEEARHHSVAPAKSVIDIVRSSDKIQKVDFVSTIGVAGRIEGNIIEDRLERNQEFHNTYEQSKAEAEKLCFQAIDDGIPMSIHRPSMVVGDSVTGQVFQFQVFYHLCDFLSGRRTFGILPRFESQMVDIVPVNYVADCITHSLFDQSSIGQVFHLCNGPSAVLEMEHLRSLVQQIYGEFGLHCSDRMRLSKSTLESLAWLGKTLGPKSIRGSARALPHLLAYLGRRQQFQSEKTREWFIEHGIACPDPVEYVERIIRRYLRETISEPRQTTQHQSSTERTAADSMNTVNRGRSIQQCS